MKSILKKLVLPLLVICMLFCGMYGCSFTKQDYRSIESIEKTGSFGLRDVYTITYTDGTTTTFEVTNGNDAVTVDQLFERYLEDHPNATYDEFLKEYLTTTTDNSLMVNKALSSQVVVYSEFLETSAPFGQVVTERTLGSGSGVIYAVIDEYVYVITNYHVVFMYDAYTSSHSSFEDDDYGSNFHIYLYGSVSSPYLDSVLDQNGMQQIVYSGNAISASLVGANASSDIAVLKAKLSDVNAVNPNFTTAQFASEYHVGETVLAIGNTDSNGISVTQGIVSVDSEIISVNVTGVTTTHRELRMDAPIHYGNSGGGLFNVDGKLVGICNGGDPENVNVNYAIPLEVAKGVAESIILNDGKVSSDGYNHGYKLVFGMTVTSSNSRYVYDATTGYGRIVDDVTVSEVSAYSVASNLGLQVGDRIIAINVGITRHDIYRNYYIGDLAYTVRAGNTISMVVERDGEEITLQDYKVVMDDLKSAQ